MKTLVCWLGLIMAVGLYSCQKSVSGTDDPSQPQQNKYLVKHTHNEPGMTFIDSFVYDAQNRVTRFHQTFYDSSNGPNPPPYLYYYDFYYHGADTLPYKVTDTSHGAGMIWLIEYDAQKRKTVDSIIFQGSGEKQVSYYTYSSNRVTANTSFYSPGQPVVILKDTFDYEAGNCTKYTGYVAQGAAVFRWQYTITYDNRINPYSKMNIFNAIFFGGNGTLGDFTRINQNNHLTLTYFSPTIGGGPATSNFQYAYDAEGYPVSGTFFSASDPLRNGTEQFVYKQ
ncbi:MAG TPA: hypothetical protein VD993_02025 [Chitinophagaceae bacterium]|nr:hypothetical protein [Chitinophagaceae bacterium]